MSRTEAAQLCPARLPQLPANATFSDLIKRSNSDAMQYEQCAFKHATLVDMVKKKEESVDLPPVSQP